MARTSEFDPDVESYENACSVLHSITFGTLNKTDYDVRRSAVGWGFTECIPYCLSLLGYTLDDLNRVNPIQITATKGKGSTAAFTAAILQHIGTHTDGRPVRVGRLTGPYYVTHRDQIAINGLPISEELFSRYFWRFWNKLREAETPDRPESYRKPSYLFFIFCLTMIIFIEEGVDVAVIEVFCGGRNDCTSMIPRPLVVSVGSIGLDHVRSLGGSEEAIAYEKSGLYKPGCHAVTIRQKRDNWNAIIAKEARIAKVDTLTVLEEPFPEVQNLSLGISGNKSALNASLAITVVQAFLSHPRRPTAFTTMGRALRTPKDTHRDMAHTSLSEPSSDRSIRASLARMVPSSEASSYVCLALAVLAALPLFLQETQSHFALPWTTYLPYLPIMNHHTIFYTQLALFILLASICSYNSYSPKSGWKNPLLLDPPLPSLRVSKHLVSSATVAKAIQSVRFPGRGDVVPDTKVKGLNWLMEAAHTPCSMPVQAVWASSVWSIQPEAERVLLVMIEPYRPARKMFDAFLQAAPDSSQGRQPFHHVIFLGDVVYANDYQYDPDLKLLDVVESAWTGACQALRLPRTDRTYKVGTAEEAADLTRKLAEACGGPMYALTFGLWPGDLHLAARLPVDFGQNYIVTPE